MRLDEPPAAVAERLTRAGIEVESIEAVGGLDPAVRAGRLVAVEAHPQADRLRVCRVDLGQDAAVTIVSAAPDLRAGRRVPVALPGATLPSGTVVAAVDLRGVTSDGVLCSEAELGLGDDAGGVLELPRSVAPGTRLVDVPGVADTVLTLGITPNRADCLSMLGVARELAALSGARVRLPSVRVPEAGTPAYDEIGVRIDAPDLCARYCARLVRGVRIVPSPFWLRLRLRRAGMRPINAVVDATNYVMLERGQPLHAFDAARLVERRIVVRRARAGEPFTTLDGVARTLESEDLVIADGHGPVALAGVMGGAESEIRPETVDLVLESAFFAPTAVHRTARRLGIVSQAAYRFERRVDPAMVDRAVDAVAALIMRLAGGEVAPGVVEDRGNEAGLEAPVVRVRPRRVQAVLGTTVSRTEIGRRLRALGATSGADGDALAVTPPSYRGDLRIEEDLIEEVARVGGYDAIPATLPAAPMAGATDTPTRVRTRRVRRLLVAEGLSELVTLAFVDPELNRAFGGWFGRELAPIAVKNPLSSEMSELRRSLLAGLVRSLRLNLGWGASFVGTFEVGTVFGMDAQGTRHERRAIAILLAGTWPPRGVERDGPPIDFADLKGVVANLLAGLGHDGGGARWRPVDEVPFLHPGKAARLDVGDRAAGVLGALHPRVAQTLDLPQEVWLAELDFTEVGHYGPRRVGLRPLPRFPAVTRDIAVIVEDPFLAETILEELRALREPLIESARLFDCYRGEPIAAGKKSLAYTIAYRAPERTLTDDEVNALHDRVRAALAQRFALELRS